jgi:hypothetical protein
MSKENLRMQMLAGVISEGQYKEKMGEMGESEFRPGDIVMWKPKKSWNDDYSVRYGAKAKVIEASKDMLTVEWLKDPSNLELVGRQMDGNYFTYDFELVD